MRGLRIIIVGAIACLLASFQAAPAEASTAIGAGTNSCGWWTEVRKEKVSGNGEQWLLGFLSGIGWTGISDPLEEVDFYAVTAWMDNYCSAHPLAKLHEAAGRFATEREKRAP